MRLSNWRKRQRSVVDCLNGNKSREMFAFKELIDVQLSRLIYDITINILETNLRLAESFAALMKGANADRRGEQRRG